MIDYSGRLNKADWLVCPISREVAWNIVATHHYAAGGSNTMCYAHGLFHKKDFRCMGVAWWLPPTRACAEATWGGSFTEVVSLSRLVVVPGVPKNSATFLLMRSVRLIKQDQKFRCLVTFADTWRGHTGHIYRCSGWEYLGLTKPSEVWIDPRTDRMVAKKAGPKTRTRQQMMDLGYVSQGCHPKHKFRLVLPVQHRQHESLLFKGDRSGGQK